MTELKFAEKKWAHPKGRVIPVMIRETDYSDIPGYLKTVTVLEPTGNAAAEVAASIGAITKRRRTMQVAFGLCFVLIAVMGSIFGREWIMGSAGQLPAPIQRTDTTGDSVDLVEITSTHVGELAGLVRVCLQVQDSGWWKGIGLCPLPGDPDCQPTVQGERKDGRQCMEVEPRDVNVRYFKAKALGFHKPVGTSHLDLRQYKDHQVMFTWKKDT